MAWQRLRALVFVAWPGPHILAWPGVISDLAWPELHGLVCGLCCLAWPTWPRLSGIHILYAWPALPDLAWMSWPVWFDLHIPGMHVPITVSGPAWPGLCGLVCVAV